jgi:WD repeat-containing protein 24
MDQRGRIDRRAVAHSGPILALDWTTGGIDHDDNGGGWVASGGLDRCVKIWDLSVPDSTFPHKPAYTLHPAYPVRRVLWRPEYSCELAVVSNAEFSVGPNQDLAVDGSGNEMERTARDIGQNTNLDGVRPGNAVEIWDVRRAWVAKWEVLGSAIGGGVTGQLLASSVSRAEGA